MNMKLRYLVAASAVVLGVSISSPALAKNVNKNDNTNSNTTQNNSDATATATATSDGKSANGNNRDNDSSQDVVATQVLVAINSNHDMKDVVDDLDNGYKSGDNSVNGNSFAAFAGILNQSFNTGIDANTQSATNIAARGTVNFAAGGTTNGGGNGGGGGGDDD
jgi:hypothetical protein